MTDPMSPYQHDMFHHYDDQHGSGANNHDNALQFDEFREMLMNEYGIDDYQTQLDMFKDFNTDGTQGVNNGSLSEDEMDHFFEKLGGGYGDPDNGGGHGGGGCGEGGGGCCDDYDPPCCHHHHHCGGGEGGEGGGGWC